MAEKEKLSEKDFELNDESINPSYEEYRRK